MPTATKNTKSKIKKVQPSEEAAHDEHEQDVDPISSKKKPVDIDEPEVVGALDDKLEEDPLAAVGEEDESADEVGLDGEELNPFGDRWEE